MWNNRYWYAEIFAVVFATFVVALMMSLYGKAALGISIILFIYLVWHLIQLSRLFHWIFTKSSERLDAPGVWGELFYQLHKRQRTQRKHVSKLNSVIEEFMDSTRALKEGAMMISNLGEVRWFNQAAENLLGLKSKDDIGKRLFNLLQHPDFVTYEAARDYGRPLNIPSPVDPKVMLSISITPYNQDQRLVIIRDVTEKHHLERVRQDFIANVSHELRTPLTVITGYLEMLDPEINPKLESVAKPLSMMRQQALNMGNLVDDLLLLSNLDSKAAVKPKHKKVIDVNGLLNSICAEAKVLSAEKNHSILFHSHSKATLLGSEKQLRSAFSNLIFNAVRYTPGKGKIDVYWYEDEQNLVLEVKDNGVGIAEEHLGRLTERFYRVDNGRSRAQGGTGLGLAIVKHILESNNAHLEIQSELGKGSSFICVFNRAN